MPYSTILCGAELTPHSSVHNTACLCNLLKVSVRAANHTSICMTEAGAFHLKRCWAVDNLQLEFTHDNYHSTPLQHVTAAAAGCSCADTRFLQSKAARPLLLLRQSCQDSCDVYVQTPIEELLAPIPWEGSVILPANTAIPGSSQMQLQPEDNSQYDRCRLLSHSRLYMPQK